MRGNNEKEHARFFACFSFAIFSVMGIAFSANMFTLFLFYEALTVSTYPLVAHKGTPEAIKGARTYLAILMGSSICIQMVAIIWTYAITGTLDFTKGGILEGQISNMMAAILLALYAFGIGGLMIMLNKGLLEASGLVLAFVPGDLIKACLLYTSPSPRD